MKRYICIEGIIGSGKTTLTTQVHNYLIQKKQWPVFSLYEQFENNKLLELFYQYPKKYNLLTEYSFLINRFHQLYQHIQKFNSGITISDYYFRKCLWFAKNNLSLSEYKEYQKHFLQLEKELNFKPDIIVFLDIKPQQAYKNIQSRNRIMEKNICREYLEQLYAEYIKNINNCNVDVIKVTTNDYEELFNKVISVLNTILQ